METWRPIKGFEGIYEVSSEGRVKRISKGPRGNAIIGRILKPASHRNGYLFVNLCKSGKRFYRSISRLVVEAFMGPIPKGLEVNHKNGIKTDNLPGNLELVTHRENIQHSYDILGRNPISHQGSENPAAKLSEENIPIIRALRQRGRTIPDIANSFCVSIPTIKRILYGKTWTHC